MLEKAVLVEKMPILKSTRELANELISVGELRPEYILEMQHRDPKWLVALYIRAVAWRAAHRKWL